MEILTFAQTDEAGIAPSIREGHLMA